MKKYKYRIYENFEDGRKWYTVKRKFLWWYTDSYDESLLCGDIFSKPIKFPTIEEAVEAIHRSEESYTNKRVMDV